MVSVARVAPGRDGVTQMAQETAPATPPSEGGTEHGLAYDLFILLLTLYSLAIMVLLVLPLEPATHDLLLVYDTIICLIFLGDFVVTLRAAHPRRVYLVDRRGWLDLLGSIPSLGVLRYTALFRLFRLSRLARIVRNRQRGAVKEILANRGQYAFIVTILSALTVLTIASVLVLQFELRDPDANITTGLEALWWGIVTITTVGYGDYHPVTILGRATATFVMFSGVGIIGALASILASFLVAPTPQESGRRAIVVPPARGAMDLSPDPATTSGAPPETEIAALRAQVDRMHQMLDTLVTQQVRSTAAADLAPDTDDPPPDRG